MYIEYDLLFSRKSLLNTKLQQNVYFSDDPWTQVGIVSYRSKVCGDGKPCIYVRVDSFLDWIESKMIQKIKKKNEGGNEGRQNKYMCTLYAMFQKVGNYFLVKLS